MSSVQSRTSLLRNPTLSRSARSNYSQPTPRFNPYVNTGGPLNFNFLPYLNSPGYYLDPFAPYYMPGDSTMQSDLGMQGETSMSTVRPNIRPRLDITDQSIMNSTGLLGRLRDAVAKQVAECPEKPFSPAWFAAHETAVPVSVEGGDPWKSASWEEVKNWISLQGEAERYDYRPDASGLIFVYRDDTQRGRAVDARGAAEQLVASAPPAADDVPGLSLGVFAAVPPVDLPVTSLLHLVVAKSGAVTGYQYDFPADAVQPLHGTADHSTQLVAWRVGDVTAEAGLKNLTEDVARCLVFRDDGWTQAWILIRIPESAPAQPAEPKQ